jgi:hypothetical protein
MLNERSLTMGTFRGCGDGAAGRRGGRRGGRGAGVGRAWGGLGGVAGPWANVLASGLPPLTLPNGGPYCPRYRIVFDISNSFVWGVASAENKPAGRPPADRARTALRDKTKPAARDGEKYTYWRGLCHW